MTTATTFTDRQAEVAEGMCRYLTHEEIGEQLGISTSAVKQHSDALRRKLGVKKARQIPEAWQARNASAA